MDGGQIQEEMVAGGGGGGVIVQVLLHAGLCYFCSCKTKKPFIL